MPLSRRLLLATLVVAIPLAAPVAGAQAPTVPGRAVSITVGVSQFDLSGTGNAAVIAGRMEHPMTRAFLLEGGVAMLFPKQEFGARTGLFIPELGAQLQLPARVAPYLGVGAGAAIDRRRDQDGGTRVDPTLSGAAGVRAWATDRLALRAELRVRGIGTQLASSAAEWTVGAALRF